MSTSKLNGGEKRTNCCQDLGSIAGGLTRPRSQSSTRTFPSANACFLQDVLSRRYRLLIESRFDASEEVEVNYSTLGVDKLLFLVDKGIVFW